jgi:hypothetical protein
MLYGSYSFQDIWKYKGLVMYRVPVYYLESMHYFDIYNWHVAMFIFTSPKIIPNIYSLTRIIVLYCQKDWSTTSLVNEQKPLCLQPYEHSIIQPLNVSRRNKRMVPYSLSITINNIQHQF